MAWHEALAVRSPEHAALTAHSSGDQKGLGQRMIQAGRMKLDELHICYTTARAPGHGNAIAGTGIGVTGVKINFGCSPGSQHHVPGRERTYRARSLVEHVQTHAAIWATLSELASADQIDGNTLLQHRNVRLAAHTVLQGANNCPAGGILGVEDAPVAVAAPSRVRWYRAAPSGPSS